MRITERRIAKAEELAKGSPAAGGSRPLTLAERAELERLLGQRPDTATMTGEDADAWLTKHSIDGSDPAAWERIAALQARESPAEAEERLGHPLWQPDLTTA